MNVEPTASAPVVTGAIRQAARVTGADFKYLLATAQVEPLDAVGLAEGDELEAT